MPAGDFPILVGVVPGVDPWRERDRLVSGRPGEITALAQAFARGAGEAELAAELGRQGSQLVAQGYTNDGASVHRLDEHVARSRSLLTDAGGGMRRVASILDSIADDLVVRTGDAQRRVAELEVELRRVQGEWDAYEARFLAVMATNPVNAAELADQYSRERARVVGGAVGLVEAVGRVVAGSVADYDWELGRRSRDLNDLGYAPPADLDAGPGDVTGDPGAGARDGARLAGLSDDPAGAQNIAEIDALTGDVRALADRAAAGGRLTDAERHYLTTFFDALGPDALARLPELVRDGASAAADPTRGPDNMPVSTPDDVYRRTVAPLGDAILALSRQTTDDAGVALRYEQQVPASVRSLIDTPLGVAGEYGGRYYNDRFARHDLGPYPIDAGKYQLAGGLAGLDRYRGVTDLLGTSTQAPGSGLATHLADSAIRTRQELNALQETTSRSMMYAPVFRDAGHVAELDRLADDSAASTALGVAARNTDASSGILLDDRRRAAVMGLNWENATGAAAVIDSGTSRDPAAGGGTMRQAEAGLAVVREVAADRDGYLGRASEPVKGAVNDVGLRYIDALAASSAAESRTITDRTDALGNDVGATFELTREDRARYLEFVSGSGEGRAADFTAATRVASQTEIAAALRGGDVEQVTRALESAGRLDGALAQANLEYGADSIGTADPDDPGAVARAAAIEARAVQGGINTAVGVVGDIGKKLVEDIPVAGPLIGAASELIRTGGALATTPDAVPPSPVPDKLEELRDGDSAFARTNRDVGLAQAAVVAGLYAPGEEPAILTRDANRDGRVDDYGSSSQAQDLLSPSVERVYREAGVPNAQSAYSDARTSTFSGAYDGAGAPAAGRWVDGREALYYGSDHGPGRGRSADPRLLDDPKWDPLRQVYEE